MSERRTFPLAQVLSVSTWKVMCPIGELTGILNFLIADNLFPHQLPRALRECKPYVLACFPELANVDADGVTPNNWQQWLAAQVDAFGPSRELEAMPDGVHDYRDPVSEACEMVGEDRVVTFLDSTLEAA